MTRNRKAKKAARALSRDSGIPYTAARRELAHSSAARQFEEVEPMSLEELLESAVISHAESLFGEPIETQHEVVTGLEIDIPEGLTDPTVQALQIEPGSVIVYTAEVLEGGTEISNVEAQGTLMAEGFMSKSEAIAAAESGVVEVIDLDFNNHYAMVQFERDVQLEYESITDSEIESAEDLRLVGMNAAKGWSGD